MLNDASGFSKIMIAAGYAPFTQELRIRKGSEQYQEA